MATEQAPARLPRGRHTLSREEVADVQRARLLRALGDAMAEQGYARTSVADVLRRARVSRETFYELFASKEDCFMHAFEAANERLVAAIAGAGGEAPAGSAPLERLDRVVRRYLDALADDPAYARLFLIEVYAAGPEAARRRAELQQRFAAALAAQFGVTAPEDLFAIEATIAAVSALVTTRLAAGDVEGLRALHAPLMGFIGALPFVR